MGNIITNILKWLIHDEQQGGINFYPGLNNIHDIRDNIRDNNIPPAYPDIYIPDNLNDLQNEDRNTVGIVPTRSVETAPIVVSKEDEYIIGNRINFLCFNHG